MAGLLCGTLPTLRNRSLDAPTPASALNPGSIIRPPFVGTPLYLVVVTAGASQHSVHVDKPSQPQWTVMQHGQWHQLYWGMIVVGSLERGANRPRYGLRAVSAASAVNPGTRGVPDVSSMSDTCSARGIRRHAGRTRDR
jgi:hypothetical protein